MTLSVLECEGETTCPNTFDETVFMELQKVRDGTRKQYKQIQQHHVVAASDDSLHDLATSWGPFQIKGYRVVPYGIPLSQLRSKNKLEYAVSWIEKSYGNRLRKQEYQDALHIHAQGTTFPKNGVPQTQDPEYIFKGLEHIEWFKKKGKPSLI